MAGRVPVLLRLRSLSHEAFKKINYMRVGTAQELISPCYVIGSQRDDLR